MSRLQLNLNEVSTSSEDENASTTESSTPSSLSSDNTPSSSSSSNSEETDSSVNPSFKEGNTEVLDSDSKSLSFPPPPSVNPEIFEKSQIPKTTTESEKTSEQLKIDNNDKSGASRPIPIPPNPSKNMFNGSNKSTEPRGAPPMDATKKEIILKLMFETLENLPKNSPDGDPSYFMLYDNKNVRVSPNKAKFPENTCFGTTVENMKEHAGFFLWKTCPSSLSFYEIINPPWKTAKQMKCYISQFKSALDNYFNILSTCENCPSIENCNKLNEWDTFFYRKNNKKKEDCNDSDGDDDDDDSDSIYDQSQCKGDCATSGALRVKRIKKSGSYYHALCEQEEKEQKKMQRECKKNKHHQKRSGDTSGAVSGHRCTKTNHFEENNEKRRKKNKASVYFTQKWCSFKSNDSRDFKHKFYLCIKGNSGPVLENYMKNLVISSSSDPNFNMDKYLETDKLICNISLLNSNRIAYAISRLCNLKLYCGFENDSTFSKDYKPPQCALSNGDIKSEEDYIYPLMSAIPSFVQFKNRSTGMNDSSAITTSEPNVNLQTTENFIPPSTSSLPSFPTSQSKIDNNIQSCDIIGSNNNNNQKKWIVSYNEITASMETAFKNNGKVAIEIPSQNRIAFVPINTNATSFCSVVPTDIPFVSELEKRKAEIQSIHGSQKELQSALISNNTKPHIEQIKIHDMFKVY